MIARALRGAATVACLAPCLAAAQPLAEAAAQSLTTAAAVQLALRHNESLRIAETERLRSQQVVREVRADGLPEVRASVDYSRNWLLPSFVFNNTTVDIGSDNEIAGQLRVTQPLYTGGRVSSSLEQARQGVGVSVQLERQVRQRLVADVETAVYDYLLARQLAAVRGVGLAWARSNLSQVEALRQAGRATQYEMMRASVQLAEATSDSLAAASRLERQAILLRELTGLSLESPLRVTAAFRDSTSLALADTASLIATGLQRRPERRQLAALHKARHGQLGVARAGSRPTVDLVALGQVQYQNDGFGDVTAADEWRRSWSTGLLVEVPLFDGRRSDARAAQARQQLRGVELEVDRVERQIEREVRSALLDVGDAAARLRAREGSVEQASRGLEDAQSRYRTGGATQLEVLDAQRSLVTAQSEYAGAQRDRAVALALLELAAGVLGEE